VASALGRSLPPVAPPAALKDRLMERIRRGAGRDEPAAVQAWKRWLPNGPGEDNVIVRGATGSWLPTAVDGVRVRRLFVDAAADRVTMLVRMDAGTSYPAHRHGGVEECYVLEGDIYGPDFEMTAGDYQRLAGGSVHGIQGTRGGCLLFIVSSMNDELLPQPV
jgi:anti-sigma factor ChrR (cupin superfamily)